LLHVKEFQRQKLVRQGRCPECSGSKFVTDVETGEIVCSQCGIVFQEEILDQKPEWRAFTPEETRMKARTGPPTSLQKFDKGLSTTFQPYKDATGRSLPMKERFKMMRLRLWNIRARMNHSTSRNLSHAMRELTRLSDKLHVPRDVEEQAAQIYRKVLDRGLIRGRSITSIAAASLYAACRLTRTPRSLREVVTASTRSRREIARSYRLVQRSLNRKMPVDEPVKYVPKIASKVGLSQNMQNLAVDLLRRAKQRKAIVGKGPVGLAAAALYIAAAMTGEKVTQRVLARAANVTEVTVRNRYKGLGESLGLKLKRAAYVDRDP
jgi:transcription initiation factor TFIIB